MVWCGEGSWSGGPEPRGTGGFKGLRAADNMAGSAMEPLCHNSPGEAKTGTRSPGLKAQTAHLILTITQSKGPIPTAQKRSLSSERLMTCPRAPGNLWQKSAILGPGRPNVLSDTAYQHSHIHRKRVALKSGWLFYPVILLRRVVDGTFKCSITNLSPYHQASLRAFV